MHRFRHCRGVRARFIDQDFGDVTELDVGEYEDPTQLGSQYYVFNRELRQAVVRFVGRRATRPLPGTLGELVLSVEGAEWRAQVVCTSAKANDRTQASCDTSTDESPEAGMAYTFEAQAAPQTTPSARERHGVDCLATALFLDALLKKAPGDP